LPYQAKLIPVLFIIIIIIIILLIIIIIFTLPAQAGLWAA
jgi:hypothetical protein